jgi:translation initiation factor 2A
MIQDLQWFPNGERFILISGTQPATATLFDKNSNPLFEFGKRYRNTIRVCPFSQSLLIGGFGNLAGEVDMWNLNNNKELGKTKAYCTVGIEWAADGKHLLSSVLYERVKVDNELRILNAFGKLVCKLSFKESELYSAQWQPVQGLNMPNLRDLETYKLPEQETAAAEDKPKPAPKRWFNPGASSSNTFAQIMRQEMSKAGEKGPKKVD